MTTTLLPDDSLAGCYEGLTRTLLDVLARADADPLAKPFAAIAAAAQVCHDAAQASPYMRRRLAMAASVLVREIAPELVRDVTVPTDVQH
jgi:hypothetical protein